MSDVSPETMIYPSISVKETLGTVSNIEVEYVGDIYKEEIFQQRIRLGSAFLNLVHTSSVYKDKFTFTYQELSRGMVLNITEFENFIEVVRRGVHKVSGTIAILDRIEIEREHRGRGLFKGFMWLILKVLKEQFGVNFVFLKAAPFGIDINNRDLFEAQKKRLESMYFKNGFQKFKTKSQLKTDQGGGYVINYLYLNLDAFNSYDF